MKVPIHILSFNLMTPVLPPLRNYGQFERASRLHEVIEMFPDLDVVILNEINPSAMEKIVTKQMEEAGFKHHTKNLTRSMAVNGGVMLFSKYPILQSEMTTFGDKCVGFDCFAAKGMVYARVKKDGFYFNLLGTHLQAWPSVEAQIIRDNQMKQMNKFIKWLNIPRNEPLIMCGDINMDLYKERDNLNHLLYQMHMELPVIHPDSHTLTIDPQNNKLVGVDDPSEYWNEDFPKGCVEEYFESLKCPCCPDEWLDYTIYSTQHLKPDSAYMKSVMAKVKPFQMPLSLQKMISSQDISDHFPLYSVMTFNFDPEVKNNPERLEKNAMYRDHDGDDQAYKAWMSALIVLVVVLAIAGLSMLYFWKRSGVNEKVVYVMKAHPAKRVSKNKVKTKDK